MEAVGAVVGSVGAVGGDCAAAAASGVAEPRAGSGRFAGIGSKRGSCALAGASSFAFGSTLFRLSQYSTAFWKNGIWRQSGSSKLNSVTSLIESQPTDLNSTTLVPTSLAIARTGNLHVSVKIHDRHPPKLSQRTTNLVARGPSIKLELSPWCFNNFVAARNIL